MRVLLFILFPIPSEYFYSVLHFSLSWHTLSLFPSLSPLLLSLFYVGLNLSNYNHKETVYFYFYLHHLHAFYRAMEIGKTYQIIIIPFFQTLRAIDNYLYAFEGIQMQYLFTYLSFKYLYHIILYILMATTLFSLLYLFEDLSQ